MQGKILIALFLAVVFFISQPIPAQVFIKKAGPDEADIFFLNELSAIITDKEGTITVEHAMPAEQRPEEYRQIDLKQGDKILMVNAKRMKSVKDFENIYNTVEVGDEIKVGVQRGEEMFILSFNKVDPEKLPERKIMIRKSEPGDSKAGDTKVVYSNQLKISNPDGNVKVLMEAGLILSEKQNVVKIDKVIPDKMKGLADLDIKEGDIILKLNGNKIKSLDHFSKTYDKIKVGEEIILVTEREKKEINNKFKKPEAKGKVFMKE